MSRINEDGTIIGPLEHGEEQILFALNKYTRINTNEMVRHTGFDIDTVIKLCEEMVKDGIIGEEIVMGIRVWVQKHGNRRN